MLRSTLRRALMGKVSSTLSSDTKQYNRFLKCKEDQNKTGWRKLNWKVDFHQ